MIEQNESDNNLCKLLLFHKMITRTIRETNILLDVNMVQNSCYLWILYDRNNNFTTTLGRFWVSQEYR